MDITTLFLDDELHVRRFTSSLTKLIKLIPGDMGWPITDIASDLLYPILINDVAEVLRTLVFIEKSVATRDNRWFKVRIMPYRTLDNRIDGVVVTFFDITMPTLLEEELRRTHQELEERLANQAQELETMRAMLQAEHSKPTLEG